MISIKNVSERKFCLPSGQEIHAGKSVSLEDKHAKALLASYGSDLVLAESPVKEVKGPDAVESKADKAAKAKAAKDQAEAEAKAKADAEDKASQEKAG